MRDVIRACKGSGPGVASDGHIRAANLGVKVTSGLTMTEYERTTTRETHAVDGPVQPHDAPPAPVTSTRIGSGVNARGSGSGSSVPYQREAAAVLADWQAVQSSVLRVRAELLERDILFAELEALHAEAKQLREEYQALVTEGLHHERPELPPFPTGVD